MVYHALALSFISFISGTYNCLCALLVKVHACERDFAGSEALQLEVGAEAVDRNHGVEFDPLLAEAGSNAFTMSPTRWVELTSAIGIITKNGAGVPQGERLVKLNQIAIQQMQVLEGNSGRNLLK